MIAPRGDTLALGDWRPGEDWRMVPCAQHAGALARMDDERALDVAQDCRSCRVSYPPRADATPAAAPAGYLGDLCDSFDSLRGFCHREDSHAGRHANELGDWPRDADLCQPCLRAAIAERLAFHSAPRADDSIRSLARYDVDSAPPCQH